MTAGRKDLADFFEDSPIDPVGSATGRRPGDPGEGTGGPKRSAPEKKKAGYYLRADLLNRFDRKYHELKLAGVSVVNKSALLEAALEFALDDLDRGEKSGILKRL